MKQLNVALSDAVYEAAKSAAARSGMLLRRWVEDAIAAKADADRPEEIRETKYVPMQDE